MHLEYISTSFDTTDVNLANLIKTEINNISEIGTVIVPQYFVKMSRGVLDKNKKISCLIDYPLGFSDIKSRSAASTLAIKNGADLIDIMLPAHYLTNRKYDKIKEDIRLQKENLDQSKIRYILEYRTFDHNYLKKMCDILLDSGINTIVPSSGYRADNLADFIIASQFLKSHFPELNVILSANFWNNHHIEILLNQNFFATRSESLSALKNLIDFNYNHKK